ncbi:MAG: ABC transporter ATP-binding protein [Deltaproteobacteria bacterium]|nr:ABC transporter ATP-binding protein [Deltaproteobacteria bacterium]
MTRLITLAGITKDYVLGAVVVPALKGVDLAIEMGEFTVLMGPSGSGKSTLLNILGLLDRPSAGSYKLEDKEVGDVDFDDLAEVRNRRVGFIFQSFNLVPVLDVIENIELPLLIGGGPVDRARVTKLAEDVGLGSVLHHRPDQLSGGQRQRVAIARALVTEPALVLADEPTANLDGVTSEQILELMLRLNRERGTTFLFSTHDPRVERRARRVLHIDDGRVFEGKKAEATTTTTTTPQPAVAP